MLCACYIVQTPAIFYNTNMQQLLSKLLNNFTMYQVALYALRGFIGTAVVLSLFGVLDYTWWHIVGNLILFIVFCVASNYLLAKLFKVKTNYESQFITAEILTVIVGPLNPFAWWWAIFLISFLAMASKYVLVYKQRHIFNPAAFGIFASALLIEQGASWWIGGRYMLPFVILGGILILQKLRWFHLAISFLLTYFAALVITLFLQGADNSIILQSLQTTVLDSALIFFVTVMLIEPLTAPRSTNRRIAYGVIIALFIILHQTYWPPEWPTYAYSFETGLLFGNLVAFLAGRKDERQTLKLVQKKAENSDTFSFWFEPLRKFDFVPGQYLEWMLVHDKHDSRGVRRFFTISAAPSEQYLRLITRFYPNPSTYKQALMNMKPGDEIVVSRLEGEFVLPNEAGKKLAFIAGGVGIAPFLSFFKHLTDTKQKRDIVMLYANKTPGDIAFAEEIDSAKAVGVKNFHVVTEPDSNWTGLSGFITDDMVKEQIPDWKDRTFYLSGPEPMVLSYEKLLKGIGLPSSQIKRDFFPGYQPQ